MIGVKHLVSKKKRRYIEDGFDLDLAYIKPNIIAMGFPSENLEGVYRNNFEDVIKFLEFKHKDKYRVYNLCSERNYDESKFHGRVGNYGFDDHNAPPFNLIEPCCKDVDAWLSRGEEFTACIHCKAGKGRTGVMICCYLLYKKMFLSAKDAMDHYAKARTANDKGVTIPSQRRYITYFGYYMRHSLGEKEATKYSPVPVLLNSITFVGTPTFNSSGTCTPSFVIYQTGVALFKSKPYEVRKSESSPTVLTLDREIPVCGDIKIDFFHHNNRFRKERMFVFWFNTFFLKHGVTLTHPEGGGTITTARTEKGDIITYSLEQDELDKANKDKKHKFFPQGFRIELNITVPKSSDLTDGSVRPYSPSQTHSLPKSMMVKSNTPSGNTSDPGESVSDDMKTMSLKQLAQKSGSKDPSPLPGKRLKNAHSMPQNLDGTGVPVASTLSRSEIDLSCENLSDDDEDYYGDDCDGEMVF